MSQVWRLAYSANFGARRRFVCRRYYAAGALWGSHAPLAEHVDRRAVGIGNKAACIDMSGGYEPAGARHWQRI